jgi:hypothetical protein
MCDSSHYPHAQNEVSHAFRGPRNPTFQFPFPKTRPSKISASINNTSDRVLFSRSRHIGAVGPRRRGINPNERPIQSLAPDASTQASIAQLEVEVNRLDSERRVRLGDFSRQTVTSHSSPLHSSESESCPSSASDFYQLPPAQFSPTQSPTQSWTLIKSLKRLQKH